MHVKVDYQQSRVAKIDGRVSLQNQKREKKGYYKLPPKSEKEERKERTLQPSSKSGQGLVGEADSRYKTFHLQVCDFLDHYKLILKVSVNVGLFFALKLNIKV